MGFGVVAESLKPAADPVRPRRALISDPRLLFLFAAETASSALFRGSFELGGDVDPNDDHPHPATVGRASGPRFPRRSRHVPSFRRAYALGRGRTHPALYRQALGLTRRGAPAPSPRAPTFFVPALSTVRALTLSPSRMTARSTRRASAKPRSLHPFQSPNRLAHKFHRRFLLGSNPPLFLLAKRRHPRSVSLADFTTSIALGSGKIVTTQPRPRRPAWLRRDLSYHLSARARTIGDVRTVRPKVLVLTSSRSRSRPLARRDTRSWRPWYPRRKERALSR
jgi:hypothetical protein